MFLSLDFIYVPTADVSVAAGHYVTVLGAELEWNVSGMGTRVASLRLSEAGPAILLSGHLGGEKPILIYRVADYAATVAALRENGLAEIKELEIPHSRAPASAPKVASVWRCTSWSGPASRSTSPAASTSRRAGHDCEPAPVERPQHLEMATVERRDLAGTEPRREDHHGRVGNSYLLVLVPLDDASGTRNVVRIERGEIPRSSRQLVKDIDLYINTDSRPNQVVHLGDHERRHHQLIAFGIDGLGHVSMAGLRAVEVRQQCARVDYHLSARPEATE